MVLVDCVDKDVKNYAHCSTKELFLKGFELLYRKSFVLYTIQTNVTLFLRQDVYD